MSGGVVHQGDATAEKSRLSYRKQDVSQPRPRAHSFERIAADGERYVPHLFRDGMYRVADPALGPIKHHAANQISVKAEEIGSYLKRGYLLRMRGELSGQVNLIAAAEIREIDSCGGGE